MAEQIMNIERCGVVTISPDAQEKKRYSCPFLGTAKGGVLTVERFLELKHTDKQLETKNEQRLFS